MADRASPVNFRSAKAIRSSSSGWRAAYNPIWKV